MGDFNEIEVGFINIGLFHIGWNRVESWAFRIVTKSVEQPTNWNQLSFNQQSINTHIIFNMYKRKRRERYIYIYICI